MSSKKIPMEKWAKNTNRSFTNDYKGQKKKKEQRCSTFIKVIQLQIKTTLRNSLVVQWLRLCAPNARDLNSIPGQGSRFHVLQLRFGTDKKKPKPKNLTLKENTLSTH